MSSASTRLYFGQATRESGVVLLEVMLAVAIFAVAMISLAQALQQCLNTGVMIQMDQRANLALSNRMVQIQAGETQVTDEKSEELKGMFSGITLRQRRVALKEVNERKELLNGLWEVQLSAIWTAKGEKQEKLISFYMYLPN